MAFSLCHLQAPMLTTHDLSPLRDGVSLPQLLCQALTPPSNLQPWFKPPVCWNICSLASAHQGLLFVISAAESRSPFWHCLSSAPAVTPSWPSLFIIMANAFGVTHAFATSPTCPSSSWGFGHLQELWSKAVNDTRFQEPCLSLAIPALNYTPLLLLLSFCLLVSFQQREALFIPGVPRRHPLLCCTL